jgi:hypothetical protein
MLLGMAPDRETQQVIRAQLETGGDRISDLHLWQVGPGHRAAVISIVTHAPKLPAHYKGRLADLSNLLGAGGDAQNLRVRRSTPAQLLPRLKAVTLMIRTLSSEQRGA